MADPEGKKILVLVLKYLKNIGQYDPIRDAELFRVFSKPNTLARVSGFCRGAGRFNGEGNFVSCVSYVVSYFVYVPQGDIGSVHRAELMTHVGGVNISIGTQHPMLAYYCIVACSSQVCAAEACILRIRRQLV